MKNKLKQYIGTKEFYKHTFSIIVPIMIQQLLLSIAGYVDSLMINAYGSSAAAYNGVSSANKLMFILNFIWIGLAATASIFIAQYFGAKNKEKIQESLRLSIFAAVLFGFVAFIGLHFFGNYAVDSFIQDGVARQYGYDYIKFIKYGTIVTAVNAAFANAFRSIKKPKVALFSSITGIIVNVFLNYCLIFGKIGFSEMGAGGAALATVISRLIETIFFLVFILVLKDEYFKGTFKSFKVDKELAQNFTKKGIPLVLNEVLWSLGVVLFVKFYTYKNDVWYTAYSYSQNISDLFFIIFAGLGSGTGIIIGASLGNNEFEKALDEGKKFKGLAIMMGIVMGVLMIFTAPLIADMFQPTAEVKKLVVDILRVTAIFIAIYSYNSVCFFTLRAGGDNIRAFVVDQLPTYLLGLPIAIVLGINAQKLNLGLAEIFLFAHLGDLVKILVATIYVRQNKWLVNLTIQKSPNVEVSC